LVVVNARDDFVFKWADKYRGALKEIWNALLVVTQHGAHGAFFHRPERMSFSASKSFSLLSSERNLADIPHGACRVLQHLLGFWAIRAPPIPISILTKRLLALFLLKAAHPILARS
jgi:hypothetical protein